MATTQNTFTGDGSNLGPFSFTFKWLESTDIKVTVAGVLKTAGTHYNLQGLNYTTKTGGQVLFTAGNAPANGAAIVVYRQTDDSDLAATFYSGSAIRAQDLNNNFIQGLYVTQESSNNAAAATATANAATTTANTALSNSTAAQASAASAISTANSAVSIANSAVSTANSAVSTANSASAAAASAVSTANTANSTASSALSAVSEALAYTTVANVAAIPGSPTNGDSLRITNSTGIESFTPLIGVPVGFVGNSELTVEIYYNGTSSTWVWSRYFPSDPETRYLKLAGGTLTGDLTVANQGDIRLSEATANGSNYVAIQAPSSLAANITYTLPSADGTSGQLLSTNGSGTLSWATTSNDIIQEGNSSAEVIDTGSDGRFVVTTEGSERARVDSSGRLLVGTSSARALYGVTAKFQVEGADNASSLSVVRNSNDAGGAYVLLGKSRGTTVGGSTVVQDGDTLGAVYFTGADGSDVDTPAAAIECKVDGTPGANDMPGRLVFSTTADGASSPTERMRIPQNGFTRFSNTGTYTNINAAAHGFRTDQADWVVDNVNANASPYGLKVRYTAVSPNNTGQPFLQCEDSTALRAEIRSNGGLANYSANNSNLSDRNAKKDISLAADTWDCIKQWEIVNYRYKDQPDDSDLNLGVIAQQVAESCPEVITVFQEAKDDQPEKLGVKEQQMYWMAIKALQEAQVRIEALEAEVAALKAQ